MFLKQNIKLLYRKFTVHNAPWHFFKHMEQYLPSTCRDKHAIPATAAALIHVYEMLKILGIYIHTAKRRCSDTTNLQVSHYQPAVYAVTEQEEAAAHA